MSLIPGLMSLVDLRQRRSSMSFRIAESSAEVPPFRVIHDSMFVTLNKESERNRGRSQDEVLQPISIDLRVSLYENASRHILTLDTGISI